MRRLLERFGGYLPAVIALTLPIVYLLTASDSFILPRASLVIGGACICVGVALLIPPAAGLGNLRLPLALAVAAALLAFAFSVSWPLSLAGSYTRYESLPMRIAYLGLLASSVWLLRTRRQRDWLVGAFVFSVSVACIKAWFQWSSHAPFRPDGDLGNANLLAALVVMAVPLAIDRARRNTMFIFAWVVALIPLGVGLFVTTSRSGDLGLVAGGLALLALSVPRRFLVPAVAFSTAVLAAALLVVSLTPLRALNDDPPELRLHLWSDGLRLVAARPLTGWGEDATGLSFGRYLTQDYAGLVTFDRVHSGPIDIAATQGILGLAALAWVVGLVVLTAWRRREEAGVPGLAAALVGFSLWVFFNFDWAPATGAFWLLAGTLWSSLRPIPGEVAARSSLLPIHGEVARSARGAWSSLLPIYGEVARSARGAWSSLLPIYGEVARSARGAAASPPLRSVLAIGLVCAAIVLAVLPILADTWYLRGHPDLSVRADPLQAQYHWAIGTTAELRRAAELGETEPAMYVQLGDRERQGGDLGAARRAYERALQIDPYYSPATQRLAQLS